MGKILIIEDEQEILENLEILLNSEGYETITACDGFEALKVIETYTPDLIISDIMIPYFDGLQIFQQLKKDKHTMTIPFIFLTAKHDLASIKASVNSSIVDFIIKPFSAIDLLTTIKLRLDNLSS